MPDCTTIELPRLDIASCTFESEQRTGSVYLNSLGQLFLHLLETDIFIKNLPNLCFSSAFLSFFQ